MQQVFRVYEVKFAVRIELYSEPKEKDGNIMARCKIVSLTRG